MQEIWKDIPYYENLYQISNLGNIKSKDKKRGNSFGYILKGKYLKQTLKKHGYYEIGLCKNAKYKNFKVHRLVLFAFIGESRLDCNHKNGVKTDNRLENLEYCTRSENIKHAITTGLYSKVLMEKKLNKMHEKNKKAIICLNNNKRYPSLKMASKILNIDAGNISHVLSGHIKQIKGYRFIYA
jgi:hypothetical protein